MSFSVLRDDLFDQCDELYIEASERSILLGEAIGRAMDSYQSPFFGDAASTGELEFVPHSMRFGAAVRYCELAANLEREPSVQYTFYPLFGLAREYWDLRLGLSTDSLTPPSIWWDNIIPGAMSAGYQLIGIVRQEPCSHP